MPLVPTSFQPIPFFAKLPKWRLFYQDEHAAHAPPHKPLTAMATELAERIQKSTDAAKKSMKDLSSSQTKVLVKDLKTAEKEIYSAIKDLEIDPRAGSKAARLSRLTALKEQVDKSIDSALERQSLLLDGHTAEAGLKGIEGGIKDLKAAGAPKGWSTITDAQVGRIAASSTALIDPLTLSFFSAFRLELAGAVAEELKQQIKSQITVGVLQGKPIHETVRRLGHCVSDPEAFRQAGTWTKEGFSGQIFPSACDRLQLIVQTENVRMHNEGRMAFYNDVGIKSVRLVASIGKSCATCIDLNGQVFKIGDAPDVPIHPRCGCVLVGEPNEDMKSTKDYGVAA